MERNHESNQKKYATNDRTTCVCCGKLSPDSKTTKFGKRTISEKISLKKPINQHSNFGKTSKIFSTWNQFKFK